MSKMAKKAPKIVQSHKARTKKHVATTMTRRLREIFLVKYQKQAFSFNKREAKVYMHFCMFIREIHA
jgi:hypothetical protein